MDTLLAELQVEGRRLIISGPTPEIVDPTMSVIDPGSGERLAFNTNPEGWARALPSAYRIGDVRLEVREERGPLLGPLPRR